MSTVLKTDGKQKSPPSRPIPQGLCSTCNHAAECSYLDNPFGKILQCEEFDNFVPVPKAKQPHQSTGTTEAASMQSNQNDGIERTGLCSDCKNRQNCNFPKAEGGVWHCEDYL